MLLSLITLCALSEVPSVDPALTRDWGLSASVGVANLTPSAGLYVERRVADHWALEGGLAAGWNSGGTADSSAVFFHPAVRYYLSPTLSGPWFGVRLPLGYQKNSWSTSLPFSKLETFALGVDLLAGWTFRWSNGLLLGLAAGPSWLGSWSQTGDGTSSTSNSLAFTALLSVGVAL